MPMILLAAWSETTASILSDISGYLLKNISCGVLERLIAEIWGDSREERITELERWEELENLNAVIWKGLKLNLPILMISLRTILEDINGVCDVWLPAGVSFTPFAYPLQSQNLQNHQLDKRIHPFSLAFLLPQPNSFIPSRWFSSSKSSDLNSNSKYRNNNRKVVQDFIMGPIKYLEKYLTYVKTHLIHAKLLWNCNVEVKERKGIVWLGGRIGE